MITHIMAEYYYLMLLFEEKGKKRQSNTYLFPFIFIKYLTRVVASEEKDLGFGVRESYLLYFLQIWFF